MKKLVVLIIFMLASFAVTFFWWMRGIAPADSSKQQTSIFEVKKGEGTREIVDDLKKSGFIRDPIVFFLLIKKTGLDGKIQAGQFNLSPAMTADEILQKLQTGTFDVRITIPEGKRAEEIADILKYNFSNYSERWRDKLNQYEGYLFPDTYSFSKDSDIDVIIAKMRGNFDAKFSGINGPRKSGLSTEEIVKIASLVEREARRDGDRPLVASVILNRYEIGMKLDIDATVQYALGYQANENDWWKKNLSADDLVFESDYNTRINAGLPPTPISNPGLKSLESVVNAPDTDYVYYLSDKDGVNHYARTIEEHNRNIKLYLN